MLLLAYMYAIKNEIKKKGVEKMNELILVILVLDIITEIFYIRRLTKERNNAEKRASTHFKRAERFEEYIKTHQKENVILLNNSEELRQKINNLEEFKNNVEEIIKSDIITFEQIDKIKELIATANNN